MEFADDIALGHLSSADLGDGEVYPEQTKLAAKTFSGFQLSFLISASFHIALASSLIYFIDGEIREVGEPAFSTLRVEFVRPKPLPSQAEEITPEVSKQAASESVIPPALDETEANPPTIDEPPIDVSPADVAVSSEVDIADVPPRESADANPSQQVETIAIPTVESVRSVLENLQQSNASRFYTYDCNKLEEERGFTNCAPSDDRDYSSLTRNPVYDFHNPAIEITRSQETVTTLARQSARVSEQLAINNLPPGLSAYVLEELEQGIETYSNNSVRAVEHMNTMVDKSAAGVMARRVFDTWVQQQSMLLQSRRVETRSDRQFRERCRSYEKFIMAPTEFAKCLAIGESPLGFSIKF